MGRNQTGRPVGHTNTRHMPSPAPEARCTGMTEPTHYEESRQCIYQADRHSTPPLCSRCWSKASRRPIRLSTGGTFQADSDGGS